MTVRELIEELREVPPDLLVFIEDDGVEFTPHVKRLDIGTPEERIVL